MSLNLPSTSLGTFFSAIRTFFFSLGILFHETTLAKQEKSAKIRNPFFFVAIRNQFNAKHHICKTFSLENYKE